MSHPPRGTVLDELPVGLCLIEDHDILYCNDTFVDLFGYDDPTRLVGTPLSKVVTPLTRERTETLVEQLTATDRTRIREPVTGLAGDDTVTVELVAQPADSPESTVVLGSAIEHSSRPPADRQHPQVDDSDDSGDSDDSDDESARTIDPDRVPIAGLAHDLRNPLNVATGNLEVLRQRAELSEEHAELIETVGKALDRIDDLLEDTMLLAREDIAIERRRVSLADLAEESWSAIPADNATLTLTTTQTVSGDPVKLRRLFENLYRNAVEHAGPSVAVEVGDCAERNGFYVADDGPGIPADRRDRVFETGYTSQETGTGLGLGIVAEIAAAHDWTATVTQSRAGGARFEIQFDRSCR